MFKADTKVSNVSVIVRKYSYKMWLNILACSNFGQANKGCWWMPWHQQAMKDAIPAISFGELEIALTRRFPNGATRWDNIPSSLTEYIG